MRVLYERCCGLDVHNKLIVACLTIPGPDARPHRQTRTFGTMTQDIVELAEWLSAAG